MSFSTNNRSNFKRIRIIRRRIITRIHIYLALFFEITQNAGILQQIDDVDVRDVQHDVWYESKGFASD